MWIGVIPRFTGGDLHYLPGFSRSNDGEKVKNMLTHSMTRHMTLEAVLRIRASTGVRVSAFHGNYLIRGQDLISSPNADEDKVWLSFFLRTSWKSTDDQFKLLLIGMLRVTCVYWFVQSFSVEFTFPTNLTGSSVCIQSALLHTTLDGQRRIRVHTLQVPIVASITEMYRVADAQACVAMLAKIGRFIFWRVIVIMILIMFISKTRRVTRRLFLRIQTFMSPPGEGVSTFCIFSLVCMFGCLITTFRRGKDVFRRIASRNQRDSRSLSLIASHLPPSLFLRSSRWSSINTSRQSKAFSIILSCGLQGSLCIYLFLHFFSSTFSIS